jgi:hypothetical protein
MAGPAQRLDLGFDGVVIALQLVEMGEGSHDFSATCAGVGSIS